MLGANLSYSDIIPLLSRVTIFMGVSTSELSLLAEKCVIANYPADKIVIEQGEPGDKLYIIIRGTVQVSVKTPSLTWKPINVLGPNSVFGEIAILRNIPRTARVTTITPCRFLTISAHDFLEAYKDFPPRARDNIQIVVAKRLQERGYYIRM